MGLTHDEVVYLFQTLGASKKRRTGENGELAMKHLTGEFGLGSKAFFAYTDAGWVIAAKDGMQETFFLSYDGNGNRICLPVENSRIPAPADWPNGVCVGYAIKAEDHRRFYFEVAEVLRWVNYPVTVLGVEPDAVDFTTPVPESSGENWALYNQQAVRNHYVRMGRIVYPLNLNRLGDLKDEWTAFLNHKCLVLDVPNKAVDVVANREALKYSDRTIAFLTAQLDGLAMTVALEILEKSQEALTGKWEERKAVHKLLEETYPWLDNQKNAKAMVKLMGLSQEDSAAVLRVMSENGEALPEWVGDREKYGIHAQLRDEPIHVTRYVLEESGGKYNKTLRLKKHSVHKGCIHETLNSGLKPVYLPYERTLIAVVVDGPLAREKIKELLAGQKSGVVLAFHFGTAPKVKDYTVLEALANRLKEEMGGWNVVKVSQQAIPENVKRQREMQKERKTAAMSAMVTEQAKLYCFEPGQSRKLVSEHSSRIVELLYGTQNEDGTEMLAPEIDPEAVCVVASWLGRETVLVPRDGLAYEGYTEEFVLPMSEKALMDGIAFVHKYCPQSSEGLKYLLMLPPKVMRSKKWQTSNTFKTVFEVLDECVDPTEPAMVLKEKTKHVPSLLPLNESDKLSPNYWDKNLIRLTMEAHKDRYFELLNTKKELQVELDNPSADTEYQGRRIAYLQESIAKLSATLAELDKALEVFSGIPGVETLPALLKSLYPATLEASTQYAEAMEEINQFRNALNGARKFDYRDGVNALMFQFVKGQAMKDALKELQVPTQGAAVITEAARQVVDEDFSQSKELFDNGRFLAAARIHRRLLEVYAAEMQIIDGKSKADDAEDDRLAA